MTECTILITGLVGIIPIQTPMKPILSMMKGDWLAMALDRELERELLAKAQDGDGKAFGELAKDAWSRMYAVCLSITGNKADAEDTLQNALTSAWRNLHRFDGGARFSTWPTASRLIPPCSL